MNPDTSEFGSAAVRYLSLGGALVIVFAHHPADGEGPLYYWTRCSGCLATFGTDHEPETFHESRRLAAEHAEECRALPQPSEPTGPDFRALAHEYALKAADALDGRGLTAVADKDRAGAAETYAGVAGVYAMLAN